MELTPTAAPPAAADLNLDLSLNLDLNLNLAPAAAPVWVVVGVDGPATVAPGETVTVTATVTNVSGETARGLRLEVRNAATAGLVGRAAYVLPQLAPSAQISVAVTGTVIAQPGGRLRTQLAATGGNLSHEATGLFAPLVRQDVADTWEPGPGAGLWRTPSGFLEIELPLGRDAAIARLRHRGLYEAAPPAAGALQRFELTAEDAAGAAIPDFATPITLRWRYAEALAAAPPLVPPLFAWWDESKGAWELLPTRADPARGIIETQVDHFSVFGTLPGVNEARPDPFSGLEPDWFTGALSYRFPLPLVTRPAGFAPSLALNYNSRRRDAQQDYGSAGSLLGFGWRLDGIDSINYVDAMPTYALALGDVTYTITKTASYDWYALEAPWLKITRASSDQDAVWHVRTPAGAHYIFTPVTTFWHCEASGPVTRTKTFLLSSITAPADDETYNYSVHYAYNTLSGVAYTRQINFGCNGQTYNNSPYVFQALPTQITYNGVNGHSLVVDFGYADRSDLPASCQSPDCNDPNNDRKQHWYYYTKRLQEITVKVDSQTMRRYSLSGSIQIPTPDQGPGSYRLLLNSAQVFGKGGTTAQPAVSFTYDQLSDCNDNWGCRLTVLDNGQGGQAAFTYTWVNSYVMDYLTLKDLVTGAEIQRDPLYSGWGDQAGGYNFVIVTHLGDLTTTADDLLERHWFYNNANTSTKGLWGQEYQTTRSNASGTLLDRTQRSFLEPPLPGGSPYQNVRHVVENVADYLYDANGQNEQRIRRQHYTYALDHQGSIQAGNVTHLREYGATDAALLRTTERWYWPCNFCNGTQRYIANRLAEAKVWQGDVNSTCQAHTRFYYDYQASHLSPPQKGLLTKSEAAQSTCGTGFIIQTQNSYHDTWHYLTRTQDGLGRGVSYGYDTEFRSFVITQTNDLNQVITTTYPAGDVAQRGLGWPSQVTDPNLQSTTYTYDPFGRPRTVTRPGDVAATQMYTYTNYTASPLSPYRVTTAQRDEAGGDNYLYAWAFYDGLGRTIQSQEEAGQISNIIVAGAGYGPRGVITETVPYVVAAAGGVYQTPDWNQPTRRYAYDLLGRTTAVTNTDNSAVRTAYLYLKTAVLDELNHQTLREQDAFGRLISSKQYSGTFASPNWGAEVYTSALYTYTVRDELARVSANNLTTQLSYDLLGRKTQMSDPNMGTWSYSYDAAGNLLTQTDARNCVTTFGYDALNRLTGKSYSGPAACASTPAVTYSYDQGVNGKGRRTAMAYGSGYATAWRYDARGRVISETQTIAATAYTTLSSYDAADRLRTLTYPGGGVAEVVTTTYNSQGLAASLVGTNVYVAATLYDAAGRVISRTLGSGAVQWQTQYTYYPWSTANGQGRLHILQSGPLTNTTLLQNLTYTYDAVGNVKTIVDGVNFGQRQCFQYDPLDRLTRATTWQDSTQGCTSQSGESISNYSEGYDYYKGGSLKRKGAADNANDGLYTYDAGHPHAVATYRGNSYGYDAVGNMITRTVSGVTYTLTYNAENRLTQVVSGTLTASYTYDGDGNRVRSVITAGGRVTETHYIGSHYEKTVGSGDTKYYYIAGQLVAFERSSGYGVDWGRRFVFRDHLGSTNVIINGSSGLLLWRDRYLPFGDVRDTYRKDNNPSFSLQTQYRFTGQRLEQRLGTPEGGLDRGLYFYGARWYDSSLGRFIQADTIVPQPGNPQSLNRYSYVFNNPLRYTDPTGYAQACAEGDEGGGCGRGATYAEIYNHFLQVHSPLYEYYALLAKLNQALLAGASAVEIESLQGSVEAAYQRGSWWVPQASFDPWMAAVDPGSAYRFGAALTGVGAKAAAGFIGKATGRAESWLSYVPEKYRTSVARAFAGTPTVETLTEDLVVYRHWGGKADETGSPWFSPEPYYYNDG